MPVIFQNPEFPNQVGPNGNKAYVQQLSFRQMINEVVWANPDLDIMRAARIVNNAYREIIDKRSWYALKIRGVINIPNTINGGQAQVTQGSNLVQGIGTAWTIGLVGQQFRVGFTFPYQTINKVDATNQILTVDTPFGGRTQIGGYNIIEAYVTIGANVKNILWAVNQQQGWPIEVNVPVQTINTWDVWRQSLGWSTVFATRPPTPDGQFQMEIWPTPYQQQVFPFEAYIQPPDMEDDSNSPASFIRADLIVCRSVAEAKMVGPRNSQYYDPAYANMKMAQYKTMLEDMENRDNGLDQQDVTWDYGFEDGRVGFGPGSTWGQSHDI